MYRGRVALSTIWLIGSSGPQRMHDEVDHVLSPCPPLRRAGEVRAEDRREGRRVREEEIAQASDRDIELPRIDALAENPRADTFAQDLGDHGDEWRMHRRQ